MGFDGPAELNDLGSDLVSTADFDGHTLTLTLDDNPNVFSVAANGLAGSASVDVLIDQINQAVGYAIASAAVNPADNKVYVTFESATVGRNSKIEVSAFTPLWAATQSDNGSGRPNPNISVSSSGTISVGPNIARLSKTGVPLSLTSYSIAVSYRGLRLDPSPQATIRDSSRLTQVNQRAYISD